MSGVPALFPSMESRLRCAWCNEAIGDADRGDSRYCGKLHRQQAWRFFGQIGRSSYAPTARPLRLAYADPPYPGLAWYYKDHPDYAGEVDHGALLDDLLGLDGFALSTSKWGLRLCVGLLAERKARNWDIATWVRAPRVQRARRPVQSTEFVIFRTARTEVVEQPADSLVFVPQPRVGDPKRVIGAKPAAFISWMFALMGARPGDAFTDVYAGSGRVAQAWQFWTGALHAA